MKTFFLAATSLLLLASCASYTDDQSKAADEFCSCMDQDGLDEKTAFDIAWVECDMVIMSKYDRATFADEGWSLALEEKCPSVAGRIAEGE